MSETNEPLNVEDITTRRRNWPSAESRLRAQCPEGESDACWEWSGHRNKQGYGTITVRGRKELTHRVAYVLDKGSISARLAVLHRCDNPPCCNPAHLFAGTKQDNSTDMVTKGRHRTARGLAHPMARFSEQDIEQMRAARSSGESCASIARRFGTSDSYVSKLVRGTRRIPIGATA